MTNLTAPTDYEKVLTFANDAIDSSVHAAIALSSAPMIGDAFVHAIETAPRGSDSARLYAAAFLAYSIAGDVLRSGAFSARSHATALRLIRRHVRNVTARRALAGIVRLADGSQFSDDWRTAIVDHMNEFADYLRTEANYALASDAFAKAAQVRDVAPKTRMAALRGRAWMLRQTGDPFRAERAYLELRSLAEDHCDIGIEMDADLGLANILVDIGRMEDAERLTLRVLERATCIGLRKTMARANTNLACIAGQRERHDEVIVYANRALSGPLDDIDRSICLANSAWAFRMLRRFRAAERYATRVMRTVQNAETRAAAMITLYHVTLDRGHDASAFREALDADKMSVSLRADLYEVSARDYWLSDDEPAAQHQLALGVMFARAHKLHRAVVRLDTALDQINAGEMPTLFQSPTPSVPTDTAPALRVIEAEARRGDSAAEQDLLSTAIAGSIWHTLPTDDDVAARAGLVLAR